MATDTAERSRTTTPDPTQQLWQVPLFLVGVAFFVAVWQGWLGGPEDPHSVFLRDLSALRSAEEQVTPNRDELTDLLKKAARDADKFPADSQTSHFLLGSGYERLAELTPSLEESRGYWLLAQQHFGLVQLDAMTNEVERNKFIFRQGKARAAVGVPEGASTKTIREMIDIVDARHRPASEDPGEADRLQADLALRLTPPDLLIAKDALTRYLLGSLLSTPPLNRDRAKLLLGEVLYRLKELEKAKDWLKELSPDASSDMVAADKALLGRVLMAMGDWPAATREWEAVLAIPNHSPLLQTASTYNLGVCKLHTNEPDAASKFFEEALKGPDSPETVAAAFRLADLDLNAADAARHVAATDLLVRAMKDVKSLADLRKNPNITSIDMDAFAVFEMAFKTLVGDGKFEAAATAVNAYAPIAKAGHDKEKRAEILAAWAEALKKANGDFAPRATDAAREYVEFAGTQSASTAKADAFRRAAAMFRFAGNAAAAVETLQTACKLKDLPDDVAGPLWVDLVDALIEAKRPEEVWKALNEAMASGRDVATATRYRLARHFRETNQPGFVKLAILLYKQIADQVNVTQAEQKYQELAFVELAHELIKTGEFADAEHWLRNQLHTYPNGSEAPFGRLHLGICLLQLSLPTATGPTEAQATKMRNEALEQFRLIVADLDRKPKKDKFDPWLRFHASLRILHTYLFMRDEAQLLVEANDLLERHRGTIEELIVWSYIYQSFKQKGDKRNAYETWSKMKKLFDALPLAAFDGQSEDRTREFWERVWFTPDKEQK